MKDYTLNSEDRKKFILNYKKKKDKIIVKFASKEKYTIPNTEENEQKILNKMKEQVTDNYELELEYIKEYIALGIMTLIIAILTFVPALRHIPNLIINPSFTAFKASAPALCGITLTTVAALFTSSAKETLYDLRKNKLFLDNEEELNKNIKENPNIMSKVSRYTKRIANKYTFDINNINNVPPEDIEKMIYNIQRGEELGFDYKEQELTDKQNKPKSLIRIRK